MTVTTTHPSNVLMDVFAKDKSSIPSAKMLEKLDDEALQAGIGKGVLALKRNEEAWDNYLIATFMAVRVIRDRAKANGGTEAANEAVKDLNLPWSGSYVTKMLSFVKEGTAKAGLEALRKWKDQKIENASKRNISGSENHSGSVGSNTPIGRMKDIWKGLDENNRAAFRKHVGEPDLATLFGALSNEDRLDFLKAVVAKLSAEEKEAVLEVATAPQVSPGLQAALEGKQAATTVDPSKERKAA